MGIKRILLKLVDDILKTPYSPKRTGSISGFLHTRQLGLHLCWTTELKYQWVLIYLKIIYGLLYAEFISVSHLELH
jgi:hypothetical protein